MKKPDLRSNPSEEIKKENTKNKVFVRLNNKTVVSIPEHKNNPEYLTVLMHRFGIRKT